jgi:hypothetical protein
MTNTLHRFGAPDTLENDYIVFAMAARGINDQDAAPRFRRFLELALPHRPVNLGDATKGSLFRPSKSLNPLVHWFRKEEQDPLRIVRGIDGPTVVSAVFDNPDAVVAFLRDVKQADLGLCINVSALTARADELARQAGIVRHSVEYSLGFIGARDKLPERKVLELATMCGHGMIAFGYARKMMERVKDNRTTPEAAAASMARFCTCGIFNTTRACQILCAARRSN